MQKALAIVGSVVVAAVAMGLAVFVAFVLLAGFGFFWPHASGLWVWVIAIFALLYPLAFCVVMLWPVADAWGWNEPLSDTAPHKAG